MPAAVHGLPIAGPLRLRRAWPRGADARTLEYVADDGELVAAQWFADPQRLDDVARATRRAAGGERVAVVDAGRERVLVQPAGSDRRLPALQAMASRPGARLLAHRAERRGTVALDDAGRPTFAKVVAPGRVAPLVDALAGAAAAGPGVCVPEVVETDDAAGVLMLAGLPGRPLHDLLGEGASPEILRRVGRAVRALHADALPASGAAVHDAAAEARVLADWVERVRDAAPGLHARLAQAAGPVIERLAALPSVAAAALHRDLHDKQVFVMPGDRIGLIDLDTLAPGDPAVDLANLAVHLELRALQRGRSPDAAGVLVEALLDGYGVRPAAEAFDAYRRATWLRLAAVYAFRPRWADVPAAALARGGHLASGAARGPTRRRR